MKKLIFTFLVWFLSILAGNTQTCTDSLHLRLIPEITENYIEVKISVHGFKELISFQYALNYDSDVMKLDVISTGLTDFSQNNYFDNKKGVIRFLWASIYATKGITLPDNAILMTLRFQKVKFGGVSHVSFSESLLPFEFTNIANKTLCYSTNQIFVPTEPFKISGKVIFDQNSNCLPDAAEPGIGEWLVEFERGVAKYYRITDNTGHYSAYLPKGIYKVRVIPKNESWQSCFAEQLVSLIDNNIENINFQVKGSNLCPQIQVDISTPSVSFCRENIYTLIYKNSGHSSGENIQLEVTFDPLYTFISSDLEPLTIKNNTLLFNVGTVLPFQSDTIKIVFKSDCSPVSNGRTYCVTVKAMPYSPCGPSSSWNGSDIQVIPVCDDISKKTKFIIRNTGIGDMLETKHYIVTEEDVLRPAQPFKLDKQKEIKIELPADGTTYRLTADQDNDFPFRSKAVSAVLEGCGTNNEGTYSKGFITLFEETDRDLFIDTDCRESDVTSSLLDMTGMPKGYGNEHYIAMDAYPEFVISFKNPERKNGKYSVILKTKINDAFDIHSLEFGSSSHPCKMFIHENKELTFVFDSIFLAEHHSNTSESQGFVKYKIKVHPEAKSGTRIENFAKIFFNYDEPLISQTQYYTLGQSFILALSTQLPGISNVRLFPNPSNDFIILEIPEANKRAYTYAIKALDGHILACGTLIKGQNIIETDQLPLGINILYIHSGDRIYSIHKIIKL
jgi:hypothetical protein